jgi:DNA-binding transcriptional MerR regulator
MGEKTYSIGFVSQTLDLPQSVLRYWETVFPTLKPLKTEGGTRRYTRKNIDEIRLIKDLLYARKFTIAGARNYLSESQEAPVVVKGQGELSLSGFITRELREILAILDEKDDS